MPARVADTDAFIDYELTDGDKMRGPYVRAFAKDGRLFVAAWKEWNQWERTQPLVYLKGGILDQDSHLLTIDFTQNNVSITLDGVERVAPLDSIPKGLDTLRVRAVGLCTSTDPAMTVGNKVRGTYNTRKWVIWRFKTIPVFQFWMMLVRKLKVYGEAK